MLYTFSVLFIICSIFITSTLIGKALKLKYGINKIGELFIGLSFFYALANIFQTIHVLLKLDAQNVKYFYYSLLALILLLLIFSINYIKKRISLKKYLTEKINANKYLIMLIVGIGIFFFIKDIVNSGWQVKFLATFDAQYYLANSAEFKNGIYNAQSFNGLETEPSIVKLLTYNYGPTIFISTVTNLETSLIWFKIIPVLNWAIFILGIKTLLKLNDQKISKNLLLLMLVAFIGNLAIASLQEVTKMIYMINYPASMLYLFGIISPVILLIYYDKIDKIRFFDVLLGIILLAVNITHIFSIISFIVTLMIGIIIMLIRKSRTNKKSIFLIPIPLGIILMVYYILSKTNESAPIDVETRHFVFVPIIFLIAAAIYDGYKKREYNIFTLTPIILVTVMLLPYLAPQLNATMTFGYYRFIIAVTIYLVIIFINRIKYQKSNIIFSLLIILSLGVSPLFAHNRGYKYSLGDSQTGFNKEIPQIHEIVKKNQFSVSPKILTYNEISNANAKGNITVAYIRSFNPKIVMYHQYDLVAPSISTDKSLNKLFEKTNKEEYNDFLTCVVQNDKCNDKTDELNEISEYINTLKIDFIITSKNPNKLINEIATKIGSTDSTEIYQVKNNSYVQNP
jgi:hypothetical protein